MGLWKRMTGPNDEDRKEIATVGMVRVLIVDAVHHHTKELNDKHHYLLANAFAENEAEIWKIARKFGMSTAPREDGPGRQSMETIYDMTLAADAGVTSDRMRSRATDRLCNTVARLTTHLYLGSWGREDTHRFTLMLREWAEEAVVQRAIDTDFTDKFPIYYRWPDKG